MIADALIALAAAAAAFLAVLLGASAANVTHAVPGTPAPAYVLCTSEDASDPGQAFPCYWPGDAAGNGRGDSFVMFTDGDLSAV